MSERRISTAVHLPETEEGRRELARRLAVIHREAAARGAAMDGEKGEKGAEGRSAET